MKATAKFQKKSMQMILSIMFMVLCCAIAVAKPGPRAYHGQPTYFGYEIGLVSQHYVLESNIQQLQQLHVSNDGVKLGIKWANTRAAFRSHVAAYYAGSSMPYSINMLEGGMSGNLYLLRMQQKVVSHKFEPYALLSVSYQGAQFFGSYLEHDQTSKSTSRETRIGQVSWVNAGIGAGVELQLESETHQFLHFFAEAKYGVPFMFNGSNSDLSQTTSKSPYTITLGASFGKFKYH
mgnify:CR=1 FL=1